MGIKKSISRIKIVYHTPIPPFHPAMLHIPMFETNLLRYLINIQFLRVRKYEKLFHLFEIFHLADG